MVTAQRQEIDEQSIWEILEEVLEESSSEDPRVLAKEVLERIDDGHWRELLFHAVVMLVGSRIRAQRNELQRFIQEGDPKPHRGTRSRSYHKDAVALYTALLNTRESVADNEYRALRDCTADDLKSIIARRTAHAKAALDAVKRYEKLLVALTKSKVEVVADLPAETLLAAMR